MKNIFFILLAFFAFSTAQAQSVPRAPGQKALDFQAPAAQNGKEFDFILRQALADGPVVVYFFPSAYTQGCDIQSAAFSEYSEDFKKAGASIVGISADDIKRLKDYSADPDFCAGKFPVASDPNGKIAEMYGLYFQPATGGMRDTKGNEINHGFIERVTFVIDKEGKIAGVFSSQRDQIAPDEHVTKALELVQKL